MLLKNYMTTKKFIQKVIDSLTAASKPLVK